MRGYPESTDAQTLTRGLAPFPPDFIAGVRLQLRQYHALVGTVLFDRRRHRALQVRSVLGHRLNLVIAVVVTGVAPVLHALLPSRSHRRFFFLHTVEFVTVVTITRNGRQQTRRSPLHNSYGFSHYLPQPSSTRPRCSRRIPERMHRDCVGPVFPVACARTANF